MFDEGTPVFLLIRGTAGDPILHPGRVVVSTRATLEVSFSSALELEIGGSTNIFATASGKFHQQGVRVIEKRLAESGTTIIFRKVGDAFSAEKRLAYRCAVTTIEVSAKIDDIDNCRVLDLGPEGFAAIVSRKLEIGGVVNVHLTHDKLSFFTLARVQSVRTLPDGALRHGFYTFDIPGFKPAAIQDAVRRARVRELMDLGE